MKFLVDAQLPSRMAGWLSTAGCDAIHTLDLPDKNRTSDEQIIKIADNDQRIVVTKDEGFVNSYLLNAAPAKLLLISTGNIGNRELEQLFVPLIPTLIAEFQRNSFVEVGRNGVFVRG